MLTQPNPTQPNHIFKPMLATDADPKRLRFPLLASPKLDGVRAVVRNGVVYSRSNKPIRNQHVQARFSMLESYDGELIVGAPNAHDVYCKTVSGVMSAEGEPDVRLFAFDHIEVPNQSFIARNQRITRCDNPYVVVHQHQLITSADELFAFETDCLAQGYEGLILRDPNAPYKYGRSTVNEGWMLKLKRFVDDEATIIGFTEQQHNANEAVVNELGYTKRSSHKANKHGKDTLGALVVRWGDVEFEIGTGMDDATRAEIWARRDALLGQLVKFKYFSVGIKEKPRHPVFLGLRDTIDL